jgi:hypothetical protein
MKVLTSSGVSEEQLFVAINEFQFHGFAVHVRCLALPRHKAHKNNLAIIRRRLNRALRFPLISTLR